MDLLAVFESEEVAKLVAEELDDTNRNLRLDMPYKGGFYVDSVYTVLGASEDSVPDAVRHILKNHFPRAS